MIFIKKKIFAGFVVAEYSILLNYISRKDKWKNIIKNDKIKYNKMIKKIKIISIST